eukprot:jgi/Orpsp1_1/1192224/evm.model.d7180000091507.1
MNDYNNNRNFLDNNYDNNKNDNKIEKNESYCVQGTSCKNHTEEKYEEKSLFNVNNTPSIEEIFNSLFEMLHNMDVSLFEKCEIIKLMPYIYRSFSSDIPNVENFIVNRLLDLIVHKDWQIRFFSLATLPMYYTYSDNIILSILSCLNDENPYIAKLSRTILGYFGINSRNDLIKIFNERGYNRVRKTVNHSKFLD